jgi:hypothetical protein
MLCAMARFADQDSIPASDIPHSSQKHRPGNKLTALPVLIHLKHYLPRFGSQLDQPL